MSFAPFVDRLAAVTSDHLSSSLDGLSMLETASTNTTTNTSTSTVAKASGWLEYGMLAGLFAWTVAVFALWLFKDPVAAAEEPSAERPKLGRQPSSLGDTVVGSSKVDPAQAVENKENMKASPQMQQALYDLALLLWMLFLFVALILNFEQAVPVVLATLVLFTAVIASSGNLPQSALVGVNTFFFGMFAIYAVLTIMAGFGVLSQDLFNYNILFLLGTVFTVVYLSSPLPKVPMMSDVIIVIAGIVMFGSISYQVLQGFMSESTDLGLSRMQSALGTVALIGGCIGFSSNMPGIPPKVVLAGMLVQYFLGWFVLGTELGQNIFKSVGDGAATFLDFSNPGSEFVFGPKYLTVFFAFKVLPTTIFFSAFTSSLFYLGILQVVVKAIAGALDQFIGTSLVQSVNAAANLFLGQTEAPLLIRPFLSKASPCDVHCVMVGGFASIAGGVLAAYIGMGISPEQLLGASVMSVPGTLVIANLMVPPGSFPEEEVVDEDEKEDAAERNFAFPPVTETNLIEAAGNGTQTAINLVLNIGAMLIAFLSLIALVDAGLGYIGGLISIPQLSFEYICGFAFYPIAWMLGVPAGGDCTAVAQLIGKKIFINEFVAYNSLAELTGTCPGCDGSRTISVRAELIATYACCGFSNLGSIGIMLGGLGALCPERSKLFAKVVTKAMVGGNLVCFLTATFAGMIL